MAPEDKRVPLFVSIYQLEQVMRRSTGDDLLATFHAAALTADLPIGAFARCATVP
ncbi:hypothetical protein [Pararhizobium sp. A13]|uniref:hypothetical protein n=1 Tax=Pararhizobium sp. A13 TaxID=3133975 RepID=UPI00311AD749